jgi:hypothetical protein
MTHPTNSRTIIANSETMRAVQLKIRTTYSNVTQLDASIQCKMLIMRSVMWNWLYYMETWSAEAGAILAQYIDARQNEAFFALFPTLRRLLDLEGDPARYALTNYPIEGGGVGLLPWQDLQPYFLTRSQRNCAPAILAKFGICIDTPYNPGDHKSIQGKWSQIFRETMSATRTSNVSLDDRMFCKSSRFESWLNQQMDHPL